MHMCFPLVCLGQMRLKIERDKKVEQNKCPREERDKCCEREKEIMCMFEGGNVLLDTAVVCPGSDTRGKVEHLLLHRDSDSTAGAQTALLDAASG